MNEDLQKLLTAVNAGLTVVKQVAELPGVNVLPYASTLSSAIGVVQLAAEAGQNILPYVAAIQETFTSGNPPTVDQMVALDAKIAELRAQLQEPLPPKEAGEED
jgi:hypothetical protein